MICLRQFTHAFCMACIGVSMCLPAGCNEQPQREAMADTPAPEGMVWIEGGTFLMGSNDPLSRTDEKPVHSVQIDGFWMDETEVTNAQFAAFVEATDYVTVAERPIDWEELKKQLPEGTPRPPAEALEPGSVVFAPPSEKAHVNLSDYRAWWRIESGANWRQPLGPGSSIEDKMDHPVVHVAYEDARAYAKWAGKQLPTEAQWEYAARGGKSQQTYTWGDEFQIDGQHMANTFQGVFPSGGTADDGYMYTAPVRSYPPNAFGLYDMIGNVWEWTRDWYRPDTYKKRAHADRSVKNPTGPPSSFDPNEPRVSKRVIRGGSFLCHISYCASYRPAARMATSSDTAFIHTGFRCVK